jgi:thiamine-monophosphate kinase
MMAADGAPIRASGENRILERFRQLASPLLGSEVLVGPGDDAAVVTAPSNGLLLLTCDMMVEGVHFRRDWTTPWQIGWKAMVQNLSDIAAMGGEPTHAVTSVSAPGDLTEEAIEEIARGLIDAAERYGASLVGGDLVGSPGPLVIDVALTGHIEEDLLLLRRGAQAGDAVLVTGTLGAAAAGLEAHRHGLTDDPALPRALRAHHEPRPRLAEGRAIAATRRATAMMDLSDGLAQDVPRLCAASQVGARLRASSIPVDESCVHLAGRLDLDALGLAAAGGEDYELLFTCPLDAVGDIAKSVEDAAHAQVSVIGEIVGEGEVTMIDPEGSALPLGAGFDHFAAIEDDPGTGMRNL